MKKVNFFKRLKPSHPILRFGWKLQLSFTALVLSLLMAACYEGLHMWHAWCQGAATQANQTGFLQTLAGDTIPSALAWDWIMAGTIVVVTAIFVCALVNSQYNWLKEQIKAAKANSTKDEETASVVQ